MHTCTYLFFWVDGEGHYCFRNSLKHLSRFCSRVVLEVIHMRKVPFVLAAMEHAIRAARKVQMERKVKLVEKAADDLSSLRDSREHVRTLRKRIRCKKKNEAKKRRRLKAKVLAKLPLKTVKSLLRCKLTIQMPLLSHHDTQVACVEKHAHGSFRCMSRPRNHSGLQNKNSTSNGASDELVRAHASRAGTQEPTESAQTRLG
jgi:hypothetical protein